MAAAFALGAPLPSFGHAAAAAAAAAAPSFLQLAVPPQHGWLQLNAGMYNGGDFVRTWLQWSKYHIFASMIAWAIWTVSILLDRKLLWFQGD